MEKPMLSYKLAIKLHELGYNEAEHDYFADLPVRMSTPHGSRLSNPFERVRLITNKEALTTDQIRRTPEVEIKSKNILNSNRAPGKMVVVPSVQKAVNFLSESYGISISASEIKPNKYRWSWDSSDLNKNMRGEAEVFSANRAFYKALIDVIQSLHNEIKESAA